MILFYINLIFCLGLCFYSVYRTIKLRTVITVQAVTSIGIFMIMFLNPILSNSSTISRWDMNLLMTVGLIGTTLAVTLFPFDAGILKQSADRRNTAIIKEVRPSILNIVSCIYIIYVLYSVMRAVNLNGIEMVLHGGRSKAVGYNSGIGSDAINAFLFFAEFLLYINIVRLFNNKRWIVAFVLFLFPLLHLFVVATTRFDMLAQLVALFGFLYEQNRKTNGKPFISAKTLIYVFVISLFGIVFMNAANLWRDGYGFDIFSGKGLLTALKNAFPTEASYYDFFAMTRDACIAGSIAYEYGLSWFYYPIINFIPRVLWTNKPVTNIAGRLTQALVPSAEGMYTFTMFGEGFVQLGTIGVFLSPFVFIFSKIVVLKRIEDIKYNDLFRIYWVINTITYVRSEAPIFNSILMLILVELTRKFLLIPSVEAIEAE